jgi:hypothetical protein
MPHVLVYVGYLVPSTRLRKSGSGLRLDIHTPYVCAPARDATYYCPAVGSWIFLEVAPGQVSLGRQAGRQVEERRSKEALPYSYVQYRVFTLPGNRSDLYDIFYTDRKL